MRSLDVELARRLFKVKVNSPLETHGWRIDHVGEDNSVNDPIMTDWGIDGYKLKRFSTRIENAFQLVDQVHKINSSVRFSILKTCDEAQGAGLKWGVSYVSYLGMGDFKEYANVVDEFLPMAIAKATLAFIESYEEYIGLD